MNEKIRTLLHRSGFPSLPIQNDIFIEKFAQLVAEECGKIASKATSDDNELRHISEILDEHFGVKR